MACLELFLFFHGFRKPERYNFSLQNALGKKFQYFFVIQLTLQCVTFYVWATYRSNFSDTLWLMTL